MPDGYQDSFNLLKLTIISYALICITGIMVILPFVVKVPAMHYFHASLAKAGYVFSFFMLGMVAAQYLNGFLVKFISIRNEIILTAVLYTLCVIVMFTVHQIDWLIPVLIVIGFCAGMVNTVPNFLIVHAFSGSLRSARLNRVDFFFSVGSSLYPMVAAWMLLRHFSWLEIYGSVIILFAIIVPLALSSKFPDINKSRGSAAEHRQFSRWNLNVYLVSIAIFLFFVSYVGFTYWLEPYLEVNLKMPVDAANLSLTLFWLFYAIGCLISSFAVQFIRLHRYIICSLILAILAYLGIIGVMNPIIMLVLISVLGLGCATVYSSNISYGTHQVKSPSPRIVSFYITCSGIGTFLGESYSSYVEAHAGFKTLIVISMLMLVGAAVILTVVAVRNRAIRMAYQEPAKRVGNPDFQT